ncbi:PH domain-containing protein [Agromyces archimandritae]|uniref:PH domain-containing protein n=1 Tax=Agromyces archimandritae TaxID=2781962 RepID=A0A975FQW5_9MICO|nr:PH domain-containing protein [Agromyces archimandritae]QTX05566.1 PH domain-containing protein [Agromyces archimandritae]
MPDPAPHDDVPGSEVPAGAQPDGEPLHEAEPPASAPVDADWRRVSPKFVVVEVIGSLITLAVVIAGALLAYFLLGLHWVLWPGIAVVALIVLAIAFEPRRVRSIGYRLREDDLLFRRGIMFQRQVAVPYGRMQLVDINRGPVARALGLAELKFVTAAAATGVTLPGLPQEEAERLRDELVALAESRRAGL